MLYFLKIQESNKSNSCSFNSQKQSHPCRKLYTHTHASSKNNQQNKLQPIYTSYFWDLLFHFIECKNLSTSLTTPYIIVKRVFHLSIFHNPFYHSPYYRLLKLFLVKTTIKEGAFQSMCTFLQSSLASGRKFLQTSQSSSPDFGTFHSWTSHQVMNHCGKPPSSSMVLTWTL